MEYRASLVTGIAVVALALAAASFAYAHHDRAHAGKGHLTFDGTGSVEIAPDTAQFTASVEGTGNSSAAALSKASSRMRVVMDAMRALGVAPRDMQSANISSSQDFQHPGRWTASQSVSIRSRKTLEVGQLVDAAAKAGASVDGPSFSLRDPAKAYDAAMRRAVGDARAKAVAAGHQVHATVGAVVSVKEINTQSGGPVPLATAASAAVDRAVPVSRGTQTVDVNVEVTFATK